MTQHLTPLGRTYKAMSLPVLPPSQPTNVAYACMLHIKAVMREQYRLRLAAQAKPTKGRATRRKGRVG